MNESKQKKEIGKEGEKELKERENKENNFLFFLKIF